MKITAIIPSRNRPLLLTKALVSLGARTSGEHDVRYIVGCDDDDPATAKAAQALKDLGMPVVVHNGPRSSSLGGMVNDMSAAYPADVYCSLCDDVTALTDGWDKAIHEAWLKRRDGVWFWRTKESHYAIVSEKWRAAAGRIFTDYFPFWWDDLWLIQLWMYVTGKERQHVEAWLEDRAPATQRMRDLEFWTEFYWDRGNERRAEATKIRRRLRRPEFKLKPHHEQYRNPDFMGRMDKIEAFQGERAPPTPEYLKAKARAEALMNHKVAA